MVTLSMHAADIHHFRGLEPLTQPRESQRSYVALFALILLGLPLYILFYSLSLVDFMLILLMVILELWFVLCTCGLSKI